MARLSRLGRIERGAAALALLGVALLGPVLMLRQAPLTFALGSLFAVPLVLAAFAFACRWAYMALWARARLPRPPERHGMLETRPFSAAQRRRART
jgi:hypothetical protein